MIKNRNLIITCLSFVLSSTDTNVPAQPDSINLNVYVRLGNDSIKVVTQNLTWDQAKKHCESEKANLASLRNEWTHAHVELLAATLQTPLWIGLNKVQVQGSHNANDCAKAQKMNKLYQNRSDQGKIIPQNDPLVIPFFPQICRK